MEENQGSLKKWPIKGLGQEMNGKSKTLCPFGKQRLSKTIEIC